MTLTRQVYSLLRVNHVPAGLRLGVAYPGSLPTSAVAGHLGTDQTKISVQINNSERMAGHFLSGSITKVKKPGTHNTTGPGI